ncbi:MAG: F0F1 ATP synthase subunit B' [Pseudomonadota bacterium]|nr:F0F1 ATP synthase subunit B' [Pseudomonadota bacterium]
MRLTRHILTLLPAGVVLLAAAPLCAAESEAAQKAGLPPLNPHFFVGQIFWLVISFTVLYVLMSRFALPGVARTQDKRQKLIQADLTAAAAANEAAKKTIALYEKTLLEARATAQHAVSEIRAQAAKEAIDSQHAQQQILLKRVQEAEARIASARDAAIGELQGTVVDTANAAIEKVAGLKLQVKA